MVFETIEESSLGTRVSWRRYTLKLTKSLVFLQKKIQSLRIFIIDESIFFVKN